MATFTYRNIEVLKALEKLTGQDFGYDAEALDKLAEPLVQFQPQENPARSTTLTADRSRRSPAIHPPRPVRLGICSLAPIEVTTVSDVGNDDLERRSLIRAVRQELESLGRAGLDRIPAWTSVESANRDQSLHVQPDDARDPRAKGCHR